MTDEQKQAERTWYYRAGVRDLPELVKEAHDRYGQHSAQAHAYIAESAYYHEKGRLPVWATVILRVDNDAGFILVE